MSAFSPIDERRFGFQIMHSVAQIIFFHVVQEHLNMLDPTFEVQEVISCQTRGGNLILLG